MNIKKLFAATVLAFGTTTVAQAGVMWVDPDGSYGAKTPIGVASLDWSPTGFVAINGNAAIEAYANSAGNCPQNSCDFTVRLQANLGNFLDANGASILGTGLGSDFEWTMTFEYTETVTFASDTGQGAFAQFAVADGPARMEIFYDESLNASQINGSGFDDGDLIVRATAIKATSGNFTVDAGPVISALDQSSNGDQYPGQQTVEGFGTNGSLVMDSVELDQYFFLDDLELMGLLFDNVSQTLPFNSVDPMSGFSENVNNTPINSMTFQDPVSCLEDHVAGPFSAQANTANCYLPDIGATNGIFGQRPDFVAQTDFNMPIAAVDKVPLPGSLVLLGTGLSALGFLGGTRRRKVS